MKYKLLLITVITVLVAGCSSAYKASQTPDDVYYSPAKPNTENRNVAREDRYEEYLSSQDDRYLRMKVRDRNRWSTIDDYAYWNDTRYVPSFSYNYYRNNWNNLYAWNNPYMWNNWNSPFYFSPLFSLGYNSYGGYAGYYPFLGYGYSPYNNVYISKYPTKRLQSVNRPSLNGYSNNNYNNTNRNYNRQGLGNTMKRVFAPSENNVYSNRNINNNNNTYRAPERTYSPSSGGSSSGGGVRSGGVSRPPR